ncbi:ankyrin repeat and LEM domain-containing protein 1 [Corapipo altera]|uniref:ankyrin repeat and LEM domain-containing protein 1 n=1 Tax=Corapipo altera TaxID=415028 RepID=UPI000FD69974|nr:ankyrin repeat and LEM domain-containing protein 1 [Corapipo altera]
MSGTRSRELTPLHEAAARGCRRCLGLLLRERGHLRDQDGKQAVDVVLEQGWPLVEAPGGHRRTLSFLTEDDSDGSISPGLPEDNSEAGPLSSTRRSLLEEQELGGCCVPPLCPAGVTAGDVTPRGQEPPGHRHITPRTRSRLRAVAERLNSSSSSSSSSLFNGTLPMPRRPPRIRSPRGVPRDPVTPPGHCVTPRDEDVSGQDGEGTDSLEDTQILPGAPSSPPGGGRQLPRLQPHGPRGSPHPEVLEGGSGWQQHSPSGTPQFQWPHGSSRRLLAPQASSSARGDLGTPSMPLSPPGCGPHCSRGHRDDEGQGLSPPECHSPGTGATPSPEDAPGRDGRVSPVSPGPLSDQSLRRRLRELGEEPGPVTDLTRGLYRRRLRELGTGRGGEPGGHSPELVAALRTGHIPDCAQDELALARQFERPDRGRRWREGLLKSSFNYLLLDPRTTRDLPLRCPRLSPAQRFQTFVSAVFYVGKGTRARPYCHLAEALGSTGQGHVPAVPQGCPKVRRILEIWESGHGVISVLCFQNRVPAEAYTREGCMVEALGLQTLTNQRKGHCYGVAAGWAPERRRRLGVHMLYRAMSIFLAEGERQLRPGDIPGR